MAAVLEFKKRRVSEKDWQQVEDHVKKELSRRETDSFRKLHEQIWREVDRQVYMKSPEKVNLDPKQKNDWHSAVELGELAKASEIITADCMRLAFPTTREWFEAHVELPAVLDPETGQNVGPSQEDQVFMDGTVRAFMAQQHLDFGFKARLALSVKEALHHGSFVSEARQEAALLVHSGSGIQSLSAPVWVPHSMWNCYPDPSPSVLGTNMLYTGSMIIKEYLPRWKLNEIALKGGEQGWMGGQLKKIPKRRNKVKDVETEDVQLTKYFGDLVIERTDGEIFLPNSKVVLANGIIVFYAPNKLPFPPILYNGYERLDVRDPYFVSPLIKLAPMHKVASTLVNKYLNIVALYGEPPILYDGNDPTFVENGGPVIAPGWKGSTKGKAEFKTLQVGDPTEVLQGLQLALDHIRQGTGNEVSRVFPDNSEKTATESRLQAMRGEVRIVDFVDKLEFSLKTFLYMQHEINKQELTTYSFYNPEMDAPDFMRMNKEQLPQNVHYDVVGSKGILGEEERAQKMSVVTAFASQNPMFAPLLKPLVILKEMYQDAGVKNPERFLVVPNDEMAQLEERIKAQFEQALQEAQAQTFELEKKLAIQKAVNDARVLEAQIKADSQANIAEYKAEIQAQLDTLKAQLKVFETASKQVGETQKQASQLSIKEIGEVINALEGLINNEKTERENKKDEVAKKLDTLADTMQKLLEKQSRPIVLKDASGKVIKKVERE